MAARRGRQDDVDVGAERILQPGNSTINAEEIGVGLENDIPDGNDEPIRGIDTIDNATNLEDLFGLMEEMGRERFSIDRFEELSIRPGRIAQDLDYSLNKDFSDDFLTLAGNILMRLEQINLMISKDQELFDAPYIIDSKALQRIQKQLTDRSVYICVLGRYNAGKSTIINALLNEEILPVSDRPETAITLFIQDDDVTDTTSQARLIHNGCSEAKGFKNVCQALENVHSGIRDRSRMKVEDYLLKIHFPAIATDRNSDIKAFVVDTPGSNEVGQLDLQRVSDLNLKTASAYIYVMTYSDIKNKEDYQALKTVYDRDPNIFHSERLTIVVTHFDKFFDSKKGQISKENIKLIVAKTIEEVIHVEVSQNIIFPVAGKWACLARACIKSEWSSDWNDVEVAMMRIMRSNDPQKSMGDILGDIKMIHKSDVTEKLEDVSGIKELERRVKLVTFRLSEIWKQNIFGSCNEFLKSAIKVVEDLENEVQKTIKDTDERMQSADQVVQHHKAMVRSTQRGSPFLNTLDAAFNNDINYERKYAGKIELLLNDFKTELMKRVRNNRKYTRLNFQQDVNEISEDAEKKMTAWFHQAKFYSCQRLLRQYTQRVSEKFGRLRSAASLVFDRNTPPQTLESLLKPNNLEGDDDELSDTIEGSPVDLNIINISDFVQPTRGQKLAYWFIPYARLHIVTNEHVEQVIVDRREKLRELHTSFFESIKKHVILYFFKHYCDVVSKELEIFIQCLDQGDYWQVLDQFTEQKKQIVVKRATKEKLKMWREHFDQLKLRLQTLKP